MPLSIVDLKAYVPAKDFEESRRFHQALGFSMSEGWGGTADFELSGQRFRLQNHFVKEWAENFMIDLTVENIEAWHRRALEVVNSGAFPAVRLAPPEPVEGSIVLHAWDPCGVLLIFVQ